eukprot:4236384-Pyramimonas_sp.AAC.1
MWSSSWGNAMEFSYRALLLKREVQPPPRFLELSDLANEFVNVVYGQTNVTRRAQADSLDMNRTCFRASLKTFASAARLLDRWWRRVV